MPLASTTRLASDHVRSAADDWPARCCPSAPCPVGHLRGDAAADRRLHGPCPRQSPGPRGLPLGQQDLGDVQSHLAVLAGEYQRYVFGPTNRRLGQRGPILRHLLLALLLRIEQATSIEEITGRGRRIRWPGPSSNASSGVSGPIHTVEEYAAVLGYSSRTLSRASLEATGLTPKQVIDARLVLEARRLLAYTDLSVCAVGRRSGSTTPRTSATSSPGPPACPRAVSGPRGTSDTLGRRSGGAPVRNRP